MALMAGTDLEASSDCYANIPAMVRLGELDVKYVNLACSRVLYAKFKAGLFENPYGLPIEEYEKRCVQRRMLLCLAGYRKRVW